MGTIANAKVTHYYNCYNGDFIGCLRFFLIGMLLFSCFYDVIEQILHILDAFYLFHLYSIIFQNPPLSGQHGEYG